MDAPTTTSADSGSGGGGGWFTPRKAPPAGASTDQETPSEGRKVTPIRPVGRPEPRDREGTVPAQSAAPAAEAAPAPQYASAAGTPPQQPGPHATARPHAAQQGQGSSPAHPPHSAPSAQAPTAPRAEPTPRPAPGPEASPDARLIRRTLEEIGPDADKVTSYFYALLFVRHPELRPLFPASMDTQRDRLLKALLTAAEHADNKSVLVPYLKNLGRGHRKYGTQPEHYPAVGECLIGALTRYATTTWDPETEAAWVRTYTTISQIMIDAAAADELRAPAWWHGEVVSHELRTSDIAVVTVRPDQPYPFLAGQYTSLETPWWPRIWRHYSFASAPRSDGLLSFHVKAVPAGWVSNALVHRARPGDVIRLGPPSGSMTVDHSSDSGLLCLGRRHRHRAHQGTGRGRRGARPAAPGRGVLRRSHRPRPVRHRHDAAAPADPPLAGGPPDRRSAGPSATA